MPDLATDLPAGSTSEPATSAAPEGMETGASESLAGKSIDQLLDMARAKHMTAATPAAPVEAPAAPAQPSAEGLSWREEYNAAPPQVQALMRQMQADYTRKTQELAEQRKALSGGKAAKQPDPAPAPAAPAADFDPFDPASLDALIEQRVQQALLEREAPLRAAQKQAEAEAAYTKFVETYPDIESDPMVQAAVGEELDANENLSLEQAYFIAKGRLALRPAAPAPAPAAAPADPRAAQRAALAGIGHGHNGAASGKATRPTPADLRGKSTEELLDIARRLHR